MKQSLNLVMLASAAGLLIAAASLNSACMSSSDSSVATGGAGGGTAGTGGVGGGDTGGAGGAVTGGAGGGDTGGSGGGDTGGSGGTGGGAQCPTGQPQTVQAVADGTVAAAIQVQLTGAIVTTPKILVSKSNNTGSCLWGAFVKDPAADYGLMIVAYGDKAPSDGAGGYGDCPTGTDIIPGDIVAGDIVDITGTTDAYVPSSCTNGAVAQTQVKACAFTKTGTGAAPAPVVVADLAQLVAGAKQYQGLLVKIENVTAENYDGGTVGPYGIITLSGSGLEIHDKFYYKATGAPVFDPGQTFTSIVGISHLDYCTWCLEPRDKCTDFTPASTDCTP